MIFRLSRVLPAAILGTALILIGYYFGYADASKPIGIAYQAPPMCDVPEAEGPPSV